MCRSICLQANSFVSTSVLTQGVTWVQRVTTGDTGPRGLRWYVQKWAAAVSAACRSTFFLSQSDELVVHECCWAIAPATALSVETNTHTCCLPLSLCPPPIHICVWKSLLDVLSHAWIMYCNWSDKPCAFSYHAVAWNSITHVFWDKLQYDKNIRKLWCFFPQSLQWNRQVHFPENLPTNAQRPKAI